MAKLKMEFLHQYYKDNGVPLRSKLIANFSKLSKSCVLCSLGLQFGIDTPALRKIANNIVGFHPERTMPLLAKRS
jgi:hypothetical protein